MSPISLELTFQFAEELKRIAIKHGFTEKEAKLLAYQTTKGSIYLLEPKDTPNNRKFLKLMEKGLKI